MSFTFFKVVANLPSLLTLNAIYTVRVGAGFDLYVSNMTGVHALKVNATTPADLRYRNQRLKIANLTTNLPIKA